METLSSKASVAAFFGLVRNPVRFQLFLFQKLPAACFSGLKLQSADEEKAIVSIPYKWFTRNPFRCTYFACLSMAAEMSTGSLAMAIVSERKPAVSMLVVKFEAGYFKKATGRTRFECKDGDLLLSVIEKAIATGEPQTCVTTSVGVNKEGEKVAECQITWSFKAKSQS